jgi:hypothetical protein
MNELSDCSAVGCTGSTGSRCMVRPGVGNKGAGTRATVVARSQCCAAHHPRCRVGTYLEGVEDGEHLVREPALGLCTCALDKCNHL